MAGKEGVIKFTLNHTEKACITPGQVVEIDGWRHIMHRLQLIGQDPARYHGYGFGNISMRLEDNPESFIITGTQTGGLDHLQAKDYALVTACNAKTNTITARGRTRPSSEALTHGQLYQLDANIRCVLHVHSPDIWNNAEKMRLQVTRADAAYGTVEMAMAVEQLFAGDVVRKSRIFSMGGHEDGVVSFGSSIHEACNIMIATLARTEMCK